MHAGTSSARYPSKYGHGRWCTCKHQRFFEGHSCWHYEGCSPQQERRRRCWRRRQQRRGGRRGRRQRQQHGQHVGPARGEARAAGGEAGVRGARQGDLLAAHAVPAVRLPLVAGGGLGRAVHEVGLEFKFEITMGGVR